MIPFPATSAFIISLLAFWIDRANEPYIYYPAVRKGLAILLKQKVLPVPSNVRLTSNDIELTTDSDHLAVVNILDNLETAAPQLKKDAYWTERFLLWVTKNPTFSTNVSTTIEPEESETEEFYFEVAGEPSKELVNTIPDKSLPSIPEELLVERIAEVRRHILVDEEVIRQIYYALLAGHVILTGPPGT